MDGRGWNLIESEDFARGVMMCGGHRAVDEAIAPIMRSLERGPHGFPETGVAGTRIAKTKLRFNGSDIVFSHFIWFRIYEDSRTVELLWVEVTQPEQMDWGDDENFF